MSKVGFERFSSSKYKSVFLTCEKVNDPRAEFKMEKETMIKNFMSQARVAVEQQPKPQKTEPIINNGTLNIEQLEIENKKTKQRLERLRSEVRLSMGINDLRKEREHVKSLILKTDERIDMLMKELGKTEPRTEVTMVKTAEYNRFCRAS